MNPWAIAAMKGADVAVQLGGIGMGMASSAKQRAWAKSMYRKRYRYTVEDMKKAGLNPILAANLGGGAVPPGSAASGGPVHLDAMAAKQTAEQISRIRAETNELQARKDMHDSVGAKADQDRATGIANERLMNANLELVGNQAASARQQARKLQAERNYVQTHEKQAHVQTRLMLADMPAAERKKWFYSTSPGQVLHMFGQAGRELNPFRPPRITNITNVRR